MSPLVLILAGGWALTFILLIRSLFRQAGIQDAMRETSSSAENQLKLWEEFGQHLDEAVALLNEKGEVVYANQAFATMSDWPNRSAFHQPIDSIIALQDMDGADAKLPRETTKDPLYLIGKEGTRTPVYIARRILNKPDDFSVIVARDASAENAEKEIRSRLINLATFQLRAPVTAMRGYASMLLEGDAGKLPAEAKKYIQTIFDSMDNLLGIIEDMTHVEELSTNKSQANKESVIVSDFLKDSDGRFQEIAKQANRAINIPALKSDASMHIDKEQVARLLAMLVNTAVRTANEKTSVELGVDVSDRTIEFRLRSQGAPLPKQSQANVFDYVGGRGLDEGIGFYVAKQIIESHGAFVSVDTQPNGNLFTLSLPRADRPTEKVVQPVKAKDDGTLDTSSLEHVAEAAAEQAKKN